MANSFIFNEKRIQIGDTVDLVYKFIDGEKERQQLFQGIVLRVKGNDAANRMITVRRVSRSGIGIERIIPLASAYIVSLKPVKTSNYTKSKLYFLKNLSDQQLRSKLYKNKTVKTVNASRRKVTR